MEVLMFKFLFVLGLILSFTACAANSSSTVRTVNYVDIPSYMGTWYEITKFPNSFQKKCLATKAEYRLRKDGKVAVKNTCKQRKGENTANGIARIADKTTNAKLKVSFVPFLNRFGLFAGDYWILDLAPDYSYVLVGSPSREFLWILSRSPKLDQNIIESLKDVALREGFDITRLKDTPTWID
jgi:apolipoprotein D and lipocalin family protein